MACEVSFTMDSLRIDRTGERQPEKDMEWIFSTRAFDCFCFLSQSDAWFKRTVLSGVKNGTSSPPFLVGNQRRAPYANSFRISISTVTFLSSEVWKDFYGPHGSPVANLSLSMEQEAQGLRFSLCKVFPPHPAIYHNLKALLNFHSNHASIVFISSWNALSIFPRALRVCERVDL